MAADIFEYRDYRTYLLGVLGDKSQRKGLKSAAARSIGCQTSVISQLLHGRVLLNLEQADRFNRFLNHSEEESHYFLLMVQKERSGTRTLQSYFQKQIDALLESRLLIKRRIGSSESVSKETEQKYYNSWLNAAVHVALSVPGLRTADALSSYFCVPKLKIQESLSFLHQAGLASFAKGEYGAGRRHIHLSASSPHIASHHRNWRFRAVQNVEANRSTDLHYSSAVTLSRDDAFLIKDKIIEGLRDWNRTIAVSPEEEVYGLNFDFFQLS